jgi:fumarate hydratase class II
VRGADPWSAAQVIGNDAALTLAGSQGHFELNVFKPVIGLQLPAVGPPAGGWRGQLHRATAWSASSPTGQRIDELIEPLADAGDARSHPQIGYDNAAKIAKTAIRN